MRTNGRFTSFYLPNSYGSLLVIPLLWMLVCGVTSSWAEDAVEDPLVADVTKPLEKKAATSIEGSLEQRDELAYNPRRQSLFPEFYHSFRKTQLDWWRKFRVEFTTTYDLLSQAYTNGDVSAGGTAGDLTWAGRWLIFGQRFHKPVYLAFRVRHRRAYSESAPADIRKETDLLWGTVDGFNDSGFQVPDFYFDQRLFDDKLSLRYGQFSIKSFVDKHAMCGAKRYFLNQAFSNNPTIDFPGYGAGLAANWKPDDSWEFSGGVSNVQGVDGDVQVDFSLDSDAIFGTVQGSYGFKGLDEKEARLQIMGWYSDENDVDAYRGGHGYSVTLEHEGREENDVYVGRLAQSFGKPTSTDLLLFVGYGKQIRGFDSFGVGVGAGRSSATRIWQSVMESYYHWQVTKELVISPDLQLIFGSAPNSGDSKVRVVGGIRLGIIF